MLALLSGCSAKAPRSITEENALPGDSKWTIDADDADPSFGAYARPLSLAVGENLSVLASAPAATLSWTIYRIGYYGGAGGREYAAGTAGVVPQLPPVIDSSTGLVECHWSPSFEVRIGEDWTPGYYVARVALPDGRARYAPFIVKDRRKADIVVVLPTATDQAYNEWGGESLYLDTQFGFPSGHAYEVSYDRPLVASAGGGASFGSSLPAVRWLEANGYDVTYLADHDVAGKVDELTRGRLVMVLAHDEYWSRQMRDSYEAARAFGTSFAFLGANIGYWQVRFGAASDGMPARRQIGYKDAADLDPLRHVSDADVTAAFAGPILNRPESALLGVRTRDWHMIDFPWVVKADGKDPSSWIYEGTGLDDGSLLPGAVGIESDAMFDDGVAPAGTTKVADSPTIGGDHAFVDRHHATVYQMGTAGSGGFVFAAGSIRFPAVLAGARTVPAAQRLVANLIARATGNPRKTESLPSGAKMSMPDWSGAASMVQTVAGTPGMPGYADGPAASAQFSAPLGLAVAPDGSVFIVDAGNYRIRRLDPPTAAMRSVTTIAGADLLPNNGQALAKGSFLRPWGIAVGADGVAWVTDPKAHRVTSIQPNGDVAILEKKSSFAPAGIAVALDGTIWLTDLNDGSVSTIDAGGNLQPVTVKSTEGTLSFPTGIAFDGDSLLVVDSGHRSLRRLDAMGQLTTVAGGNPEAPFVDGNGHVAGLEPLLGIGKLGPSWLVADCGNYRIRSIVPGATPRDTKVSTFAGHAARIGSRDGDGPSAEMALPTGLAVDTLRQLAYVADAGNATIRVLTP